MANKAKKILLNKNYIVQLNITGRCALNCSFCYMKDFSSENISLANIMHLWNNLRFYSSKHNISYEVNLTGGDVFMHPQWREICRFLCLENSVRRVNLLLNRFWNDQNKEILGLLGKKLGNVQFNLDVVEDSDLSAVKGLGKVSIIKMPLYDGSEKRDLRKLRKLTERFNNLHLALDVIIPTDYRDHSDNCRMYALNNRKKIKKEILSLKRIFGNKLSTMTPSIRKIMHETPCFCPVPFGGMSVMPDGKIAACAKFPKLDTGYNIYNFDLEEYVTKFNSLNGTCCLFENKEFARYWKKQKNPKFKAGETSIKFDKEDLKWKLAAKAI